MSIKNIDEKLGFDKIVGKKIIEVGKSQSLFSEHPYWIKLDDGRIIYLDEDEVDSICD